MRRTYFSNIEYCGLNKVIESFNISMILQKKKKTDSRH
jgi:hypothetical protein